MFSNPVTKTFLLLCGITVAFVAPRPAQAQTFSAQCGFPGTVSCGSSLSIIGGSSLDTIVVNGSITSQLTLASGLPSQISGLDDFTVGAESFLFSCSGVTAFGTAGTFKFVDSTDDDLTITGTAQVGSLATVGSEPLAVELDLTIQQFSVGGPDDGGTTFSATGGNGGFEFLLNGDSGLASSGYFENFGSFTAATPEPGTLLLLGSGFLGLLASVQRRTVRGRGLASRVFTTSVDYLVRPKAKR